MLDNCLRSVRRYPDGPIAFQGLGCAGGRLQHQVGAIVELPYAYTRIRPRRVHRVLALGWAGLGGTELPDSLTPLTPEQAAQALATAYRRVTGQQPTKTILGLLVAQSAQETAQWKSLHNFNFENSKATPSDAYYQNFRCWEVEGGQTVWYDPPDPHCRFAAFTSAADGAEHYLRLLARRPNWWNGLHTGTVDGFVAGLTTPPVFFTGDPGAYARRMEQFMGEYASLAAKYAGEHPGAVVGTAIASFVFVGGMLYLYSAVKSTSRRRVAA